MVDRLIATLDQAGMRRISTDLWGVFFEDISYAADGGLNSELVQNGAFEYSRADNPDWSNYTAWRKSVPVGSTAAYGIRTEGPVAVENPHYARIEVTSAAGGPVGLENLGFDGMALHVGETYDLSFWARVKGGGTMRIKAVLIGDGDAELGSVMVEVAGGQWAKVKAAIALDSVSGTGQTVDHAEIAAAKECSQESCGACDVSPLAAKDGSLRLCFCNEGVIDLDFVSLEPRTTYKGLKHFRPDLVEALDELHPRFVRFPGGCITHGLGLDNMYRWERTIGPVEHRPHNFNVWGYHQSFRIGFYEYLRLCETIGAKPLPVLPAGVSCQNTSQGPIPITDEDMPAYIDTVLGLIDFCNADPTDNAWAAERAAMGHPEPFGLEYLGIGNEDLIDTVFEDRFGRIFDAVQQAHPEITVVGTVGPSPAGQDYEAGWAYARKTGVPIVDEHSYQSPSWWFRHLDHYDQVDRKGPKVYLGEYGSKGAHLINGLAEAAFMGRMELNGDAVVMASYAPLFCRNGHGSWDPNLIYFDAERAYLPVSYWVQRMVASTAADTAWPVTLDGTTTIRRNLPDTLGLKFTGGAHADLTGITVTDDDGRCIRLPDVIYRGAQVVLPLDERADAYTVELDVTYHSGMWGVQMHTGDVDGLDHNITSFGRGFGLELVRDDGSYAIAGTEISMDAVRPGTVWHATVRVDDRGAAMSLAVDGKEVCAGRETPDEPRRTVAVARDTACGVDYVRIVNATSQTVDIDITQPLDALGVSVARRSGAHADVLAGDDPYAGRSGEESPVHPVHRDVDLTGGVWHAPAWSFAVLAL